HARFQHDVSRPGAGRMVSVARRSRPTPQRSAKSSMGTINLSNSKGRDAVVGSATVKKPLKVRWLDGQGRQAQSARVMKADLSHDLTALEAKAGGRDKIAAALIAEDPDIDLENFGSFLRDTSRVFVDPDGKIV